MLATPSSCVICATRGRFITSTPKTSRACARRVFRRASSITCSGLRAVTALVFIPVTVLIPIGGAILIGVPTGGGDFIGATAAVIIITGVKPQRKRVPMNYQLENKLCLVTGSTGGIGFAIATALAGEGAKVIINGRTDDRVAEAIVKIHKRNPEAKLEAFAGDLSQVDEGAEVYERFPEIDGLFTH